MRLARALCGLLLVIGIACRSEAPGDAGGTVDAHQDNVRDAAGDVEAIAPPPDAFTPLRDPGIPGTPYGPKFGGKITIGSRSVQYLGTATAVARDGIAHFFGVNTAGSVRSDTFLSEIYLSFLFPAETWAPGAVTLSTPGIVGTYTVVESASGHRFKLDFANPLPGSEFELSIMSSFTTAQDPDVHYLRGWLKAKLPNVTEPGAFAVIDFTVN